jgi:hypothetical protein
MPLDLVSYKQQEFISHRAGGWEVHHQGASRYGVWQELVPWFLDGTI